METYLGMKSICPGWRTVSEYSHNCDSGYRSASSSAALKSTQLLNRYAEYVRMRSMEDCTIFCITQTMLCEHFCRCSANVYDDFKGQLHKVQFI
jgi:hypothetical protein